FSSAHRVSAYDFALLAATNLPSASATPAIAGELCESAERPLHPSSPLLPTAWADGSSWSCPYAKEKDADTGHDAAAWKSCNGRRLSRTLSAPVM
ncbi:MAG: hypothetical protein AAB431_03455, partial [Patescibacteria group bacterium]